MRQRFQRYFQLDRLPVSIYLGGSLWLALGLMFGGCRPARPGAVVPMDLPAASAADVRAWVEGTVPRESRLHHFKWLYKTGERGRLDSFGGRGSARIAPPDSLRFDAAGSFDFHPIAAVVIGDRPLWAEPPDSLEKLVPNYPLLWAMFGVARQPDSAAVLRGVADSGMRTWRYIEGGDTVDYRDARDARTGAGILTVEVRKAGTVLGRAETTIGADGALRKSHLDVPSVPAKLDITFSSTERKTFAPEIWRRRNP